ncbi:MAG: peptidase C11 [Clostridia bacterium]|nr:peptidase C11 [Clostridia bacterium]
MNNRPRGRQKHVTGSGNDINIHGSGLNTGPVGRPDGYSGRNDGSQQYSGSSRGRGIGLIAVIAIVALLLFGGGGLSLGGLFGGDPGGSVSTTQTPVPQTPSTQTIGNTSGSSGSLLSTLLGGSGDYSGGFSGGSNVSSGWDQTANTGRLNTSVAPGSRSKYTKLAGGGNDTVTIMVYMCGTDLESKHKMATSDLSEMASASLSDKVNIIVYTGGCKRWNNNFVSNSVNQIYKVEGGGLRCLVSDDGNASMTKPATLTRFIKFCTQNFPASRNELILWDHGGGSITGFGYDEKNMMSGSMTLKGINEALTSAGTKFDFVGFDACLMATLETGLMLNNHADYLIGSEETEPGIGWHYTNWLTELSRNTSMPTIEIGKNIVDDFVAVCGQRCAGQKTTLSVIDLAELSATVPGTFKDFSTSTSQMLQNNQYKTVSDARSSTREFSVSSKIDQVDLVHLAYNLGTDEGKALAESIRGAVKYNRTSSNMTNAYGLSIYFPYKKTSQVSNAVATYQAIGLDDEYARCIQQFASLEVGGQAAAGGTSSPMTSLFGDSSGGSAYSGSLTDILGSLLGGNISGISGLTSDNFDFFGRSIDVDSAAQYLSDNRFDPSQLVWTTSGGKTQMRLSEDQWSMVHDLQLNVFYDDGRGYIDLGLDNVFDFTDDGALVGEYDGTWLAIDSNPVAYYYMDSIYEGDNYTITGRIPVLLNDSRADLIIVFDNAHPYGYIAGARADYVDGETETVAKSITELSEGDRIQPVCDYYTYNGDYENSYRLGNVITYNGNHEISNVYIKKEATTASYLFTDIYNQEYWTPAIP